MDDRSVLVKEKEGPDDLSTEFGAKGVLDIRLPESTGTDPEVTLVLIREEPM